MRIMSISNCKFCCANSQKNAKATTNQSTNFKGLLKPVDRSENNWDYHGQPSGSSNDGHYMGFDTYEAYVYYPFKDEPKDKIDKVLKDNNYSNYIDPDSTGGFSGSDVRDTTLGKTLPFTEREWNGFSKKQKEYFMDLL